MKRKLSFYIISFLMFHSVIFAKELIDVASGKFHSLLLFDDGRILPFGENYSGQLGLALDIKEQSITVKSPLYIDAPVQFISVAAGWERSLAVDADGSLWGWGKLGLSNPEKPQLLTDSKDWKKVFSGGYESLALKKDGTLYRLPSLEPVKHPEHNSWKDVRIFGEDWGGREEYTLIVVLQDSKGKFWEYGSCNDFADDFSVLNSFIDGKGSNEKFYDILPLELPSGTIDLQVTDVTGCYQNKTDIVMFGLSACNYEDIVALREIISGEVPLEDIPLHEYLSSITKKEKNKKYKKTVTGNFLDTIAFFVDTYFPEEDMHYQSYSALLQHNGQLIVYTNGKKLLSDKKMKIKNVFGGYNIFVQTEDDTIYGIGYFYPENDYLARKPFSHYIPIQY